MLQFSVLIIIGYLHLNMVSCTCTHSTFKDRYLSNDSRVVTKRKERSPPTFNIAFKVTLRGAEEGKKTSKNLHLKRQALVINFTSCKGFGKRLVNLGRKLRPCLANSLPNYSIFFFWARFMNTFWGVWWMLASLSKHIYFALEARGP